MGEQAGVPVFEMGTEKPVPSPNEAVSYAKDHGNDIVILDTAGRLQIDDQLMDELSASRRRSKPTRSCWSWMP